MSAVTKSTLMLELLRSVFSFYTTHSYISGELHCTTLTANGCFSASTSMLSCARVDEDSHALTCAHGTFPLLDVGGVHEHASL